MKSQKMARLGNFKKQSSNWVRWTYPSNK